MARKITSILVYNANSYYTSSSQEVQVNGSNELLTHLSRTVEIQRSLGEPDLMSFSVVRGSPWYVDRKIGMRTRLMVLYDDGVREMYRVREVSIDTSGNSDMDVEAWPIWTDLGNMYLQYVRSPQPVVTYQYPLTRLSLNDLLTNVVFNAQYGIGGFFIKGDVDSDISSTEVNLKYNVYTFLDLIHDICDQVNLGSGFTCEIEGEYDYATNQYKIHFRREVGLDASETGPYNPLPDKRPIIGVGKTGDMPNRVGVRFSEDQADFYTRLIPFCGPQQERVGLGGAWLDIASYDSGTRTFTMAEKVIPHTGDYVTDIGGGPLGGLLAGIADHFFIETDNGGASSGWRIQTTTAPDKIQISTGDSSFASATKLRLYTTRGKNLSVGLKGSYVTFVHDWAAEQSKNVIEVIADFPSVVPYENLFPGDVADFTPWGAYPDTVPSGWSDAHGGTKTVAIRQLLGSTKQVVINGKHTVGLYVGKAFTFDMGGWGGTYTVATEPFYNAAQNETSFTFTEAAGSPDLAYDALRTTPTLSFAHEVNATEETSPLYVRYGTSAARVTSKSAGGVFRTAYMTFTRSQDNPYYSLWTAVRVISGGVRVSFWDEANEVFYPPRINSAQAQSYANEMYAIQIEGMVPTHIEVGESVLMRVIYEALEENTEYVVDSLAVTNSPTAWEYSDQMGLQHLQVAAANEIQRTGGFLQPSYDTEFYDVTKLDPLGGFLDVNLGSWVHLQDMYDGSTYLVDISARVISIREEFDLIDGNYWKEAKVNDERPTLADRLSGSVERQSVTPLPPVPVETATDPVVDEAPVDEEETGFTEMPEFYRETGIYTINDNSRTGSAVIQLKKTIPIIKGHISLTPLIYNAWDSADNNVILLVDTDKSRGNVFQPYVGYNVLDQGDETHIWWSFIYPGQVPVPSCSWADIPLANMIFHYDCIDPGIKMWDLSPQGVDLFAGDVSWPYDENRPSFGATGITFNHTTNSQWFDEKNTETYTLTGSSDGVKRLGAAEFTIFVACEAVDAGDANEHWVFGKGNDDTASTNPDTMNYGFYFKKVSGTLYPYAAFSNVGNTTTHHLQGPAVTAGTDYIFTIRYDQADFELYVDRMLTSQSSALTDVPETNEIGLTVGKLGQHVSPDVNTYAYNGTLRYLVGYNNAKTDAECQDIYDTIDCILKRRGLADPPPVAAGPIPQVTFTSPDATATLIAAQPYYAAVYNTGAGTSTRYDFGILLLSDLASGTATKLMDESTTDTGIGFSYGYNGRVYFTRQNPDHSNRMALYSIKDDGTDLTVEHSPNTTKENATTQKYGLTGRGDKLIYMLKDTLWTKTLPSGTPSEVTGAYNNNYQCWWISFGATTDEIFTWNFDTVDRITLSTWTTVDSVDDYCWDGVYDPDTDRLYAVNGNWLMVGYWANATTDLGDPWDPYAPGGNPSDFVRLHWWPNTPDDPRGVTLDTNAQKVYWTDGDTDAVWQMTYGGASKTKIRDTNTTWPYQFNKNSIILL